MNSVLSDWRDVLPLAGLVALAAIGMVFWLRRKPEDESEVERQRRSYLNRVGRIVEGHVLEVVDHKIAAPASNGNGKSSGLFGKAHAHAPSNGSQKLLYYTYSISGVTYETAQDVTGLEERLHLTRVATGQIASVKYDPSNPSNSILLADDWSGLH
ncbi:MAG TPA: hypothetical protein VMB02_06210 [Candidatus Aquilonibacter sp.]|nr:hypothetical protein [Candidatus Aquilonibacter sp.]